MTSSMMDVKSKQYLGVLSYHNGYLVWFLDLPGITFSDLCSFGSPKRSQSLLRRRRKKLWYVEEPRRNVVRKMAIVMMNLMVSCPASPRSSSPQRVSGRNCLGLKDKH